MEGTEGGDNDSGGRNDESGPSMDSEQAAKLLVLMCHARGCPGDHRSARLAEVRCLLCVLCVCCFAVCREQQQLLCVCACLVGTLLCSAAGGKHKYNILCVLFWWIVFFDVRVMMSYHTCSVRFNSGSVGEFLMLMLLLLLVS